MTPRRAAEAEAAQAQAAGACPPVGAAGGPPAAPPAAAPASAPATGPAAAGGAVPGVAAVPIIGAGWPLTGKEQCDAMLADLLKHLLDAEPDSAPWCRLMTILVSCPATDEAICSHVVHQVCVRPVPCLTAWELVPETDLLRPCLLVHQLQRRGRPRTPLLLARLARRHLLNRRPSLPPPCRVQLVRLHTALCRLRGAAGAARALLLDAAVLWPLEAPRALLAVIHTWSKAFNVRQGVALSPVEEVLLQHVLTAAGTGPDDTLAALAPELRRRYRQYKPEESPDQLALGLVRRLAGWPPEEERAQLRAALLLLSALCGPVWTNDQPLERAVVPLLDDWRCGREPDQAAAACLTLTAELTALYPERSDRMVEEAVCILEGVALHKKQASALVCTAAKKAAQLLRVRVPADSAGRLLRCIEALPPTTGATSVNGSEKLSHDSGRYVVRP